MQGIKAIKALVAFMGLLLVAGLALLGYGLMNASKGGKVRPATTIAAPAGEFGTVSVPLPAGTRLEQTLVVGDKVVLRLAGGGGDRLLVLDPADGKVVGSFVLSPEAPAGR